MLDQITTYCDTRMRTLEIGDYPGAENGLQFANSGKVTKIGAAVDAGLLPFSKAIESGIDFLIVHHGLFWNSPQAVTGSTYEKYAQLIRSDCAVYSSHLPLDCHPEIGNNAIIAKKLDIKISEWTHEHEGNPIAAIADSPHDRNALSDKLKELFSNSFTAIEYGKEAPSKVAILSGSGGSILPHMKEYGVDTLITGELKQEHYNFAQEECLNLYPCGHYATEGFGVKALAEEASKKFDLPWEFIEMDCPL